MAKYDRTWSGRLTEHQYSKFERTAAAAGLSRVEIFRSFIDGVLQEETEPADPDPGNRESALRSADPQTV